MAKKKTPTGAKGSGPEAAETPVTFEEALSRLEKLVERLEEGEVPLEESLAAYTEGTRLVKKCLEKLDRAEVLIRELNESTEGFRLEASTLDADAEDDPDQDELDF